MSAPDVTQAGVLHQIIDELRSIRAAIERLTLPTETEHGDRLVYPASAKSNLNTTDGPLWQCGHHHPTRGEAMRCEAEQEAASERARQEQNKFSPQEVHAAHNKPPNADAGSFD